MRTASTIPHVIEYLYNRFTLRLPNVQVTIGEAQPPLDLSPDLLNIAFNGTAQTTAVENTREIKQTATSPNREQYEITCLCSSWYGNDTDMLKVMKGAFAILDAVANELALDQTLGGLVMRSRIITDRFAPEQTTEGAVCTILFVIQVDAFTNGT